MNLEGSRIIDASRDVVWQALNDSEILKLSIPGCTELTGNAVDGFEAVVTQKVGPVKATFKGSVSLTDIVEGKSYKLTGAGKGGPAGFAKGAADISLEDAAGGTRLSYSVEAKMGGKMAQLGSRVINGVATKLADKFFENFAHAVAPPVDESAGDVAQTSSDSNAKKGFWATIFGWFQSK